MTFDYISCYTYTADCHIIDSSFTDINTYIDNQTYNLTYPLQDYTFSNLTLQNYSTLYPYFNYSVLQPNLSDLMNNFTYNYSNYWNDSSLYSNTFNNTFIDNSYMFNNSLPIDNFSI